MTEGSLERVSGEELKDAIRSLLVSDFAVTTAPHENSLTTGNPLRKFTIVEGPNEVRVGIDLITAGTFTVGDSTTVFHYDMLSIFWSDPQNILFSEIGVERSSSGSLTRAHTRSWMGYGGTPEKSMESMAKQIQYPIYWNFFAMTLRPSLYRSQWELMWQIIRQGDFSPERLEDEVNSLNPRGFKPIYETQAQAEFLISKTEELLELFPPIMLSNQ